MGLAKAVVLANPSPKGEAVLFVVMERWFSACRTFLRCEDGGTVKSEKMHRSSTFCWLLSVDHALRILIGNSLEQFARNDSPLPVGARKHLEDSLGRGGDWEHCRLAVAADQCSVGVSAMTYADQVLGINAELIADMPYRRWVSEKNALTAGGGWEIVLFHHCLLQHRLWALVVCVMGGRLECGASGDVTIGWLGLSVVDRLVASFRQGQGYG